MEDCHCVTEACIPAQFPLVHLSVLHLVLVVEDTQLIPVLIWQFGKCWWHYLVYWATGTDSRAPVIGYGLLESWLQASLFFSVFFRQFFFRFSFFNV